MPRFDQSLTSRGDWNRAGFVAVNHKSGPAAWSVAVDGASANTGLISGACPRARLEGWAAGSRASWRSFEMLAPQAPQDEEWKIDRQA